MSSSTGLCRSISSRPQITSDKVHYHSQTDLHLHCALQIWNSYCRKHRSIHWRWWEKKRDGSSMFQNLHSFCILRQHNICLLCFPSQSYIKQLLKYEHTGQPTGQHSVWDTAASHTSPCLRPGTWVKALQSSEGSDIILRKVGSPVVVKNPTSPLGNSSTIVRSFHKSKLHISFPQDTYCSSFSCCRRSSHCF